MLQYKEDYRICTCCGKKMSSGYVIDDGLEYFCSDECLWEYYSLDKYEELYEQDAAYWTEWEVEAEAV